MFKEHRSKKNLQVRPPSRKSGEGKRSNPPYFLSAVLMLQNNGNEQKPFGVVSEPYWERVFLVGGGPSLLGFDFSVLRGRTVVAINDALLHLPYATAVLSVDSTWIRKRRKELSAFEGEEYLVVGENFSRDLRNATYLQQRTHRGLSTDPSIIHVRGNSGYAALNLAFLKRARTIVLLGFDLRDGARHWYQRYSWAPASVNDKYYFNWAKEFDLVAPQLVESGIKVYNASRCSRIKAFEKVDLHEIINLI